MIFIFMLISLALLEPIGVQSASFKCDYRKNGWRTLDIKYFCIAVNIASITTPDAATVDSISGQHLVGFNNDNVEAINFISTQINYFPRGLNIFFKNLRGIDCGNTGLKEVHQSDLKDHSKLVQLYLQSNNLEILEENLFEFNPNLELIYLPNNKISHIDPNVFDKLIKLKSLYLDSNTCINMVAFNSTTKLLNVIRTSKANCTNPEYSSLEQHVKYLEFKSKNLNSENLKEKVKNLENEIKYSKFPHFFQENLKGLNASIIMREHLSKINDKLVVQDSKISGIEKKLEQIIDEIEKISSFFGVEY